MIRSISIQLQPIQKIKLVIQLDVQALYIPMIIIKNTWNDYSMRILYFILAKFQIVIV